MIKISEIEKLISQMNDDVQGNVKKIINYFGNLDYVDEDDEQSILHILVDNKYDEKKCFLAIKSLLKCGMNPNLEAYFRYNFIQTAMYTGYSEKFILSIIKEALKYGLKINHRDNDLDTMMHTAIYSDDYLGEVEAIYDLLHENGFESKLLDHDSRNIVDAMIFQGQYTKDQIERIRAKYNERISSERAIKKEPVSTKRPVNNTINIPEEDLVELEKFGHILNKKQYLTSPTIGRDKELKNVMITLAQDKKSPLIVGESGVGKTCVVEELVYRIINGDVPKFLQGKIVLETTASQIVAGCQYVGMFEDNMTKFLNLCEKYNVIVFIDEIHTIYGVGSSKGKDNDMAAMLKHYLDRTNLKVIGTTTDKEYDEYFSEDALKRRFEKIPVKEPVDKDLFKIINKVLDDYFIKNDIMLENENVKKEIINIIIEATSKKHRVYNDVVNNPDLAISIVDRAIAFAKVYDSEFVSVDHFIESFECCDRIYETIREQAIDKLKKLKDKKDKTDNKILVYEFPNNRNN